MTLITLGEDGPTIDRMTPGRWYYPLYFHNEPLADNQRYRQNYHYYGIVPVQRELDDKWKTERQIVNAGFKA